MVSSFMIEAILLRLIFRVFARVAGLADAKKTALGAIGNTIKHDGSLSGIPHGCGARGDVSSGRSPIKITGLGQRRIHHIILPTVAVFSGSVLSSIAM